MNKNMAERKSGHYYLLNKAFRTSLTAALFSSMINNICSATDALITGNMIGQEALSSIGLTIPIITALNCFMDLMFDGAIARSSTDLGNHDIAGMNRRLSAGLFSGYLLTMGAMIVLQIVLVPVSGLLAPDSEAVRRGFVVNGAVVRTAGSLGLSVMTVGVQLSSIVGAAAFGLRKSMQLIGGLLQGEKDVVSLRYLFGKVLRLTMISVAAAAGIVLLIPVPIMQLFGVKDPTVLSRGAVGLRTYIIFLIPLYFTVTCSVVYQIQKHYTLATVISALPVLLVICFAEIFSRTSPDLFWWSFFLGGFITVCVQLAAAGFMWKKQKNCCYPSLIPKQDEEPSLLISSAYTEEDTQKALREAEAFLKEQKIRKKTADQAVLCMDEIFHNILEHAKIRKTGYYNARFRIGQSLYVTVRDNGTPFNPVLTEESLEEGKRLPPEAAPGLRIINRMNSEITYSFVCSQNMLQLRWDL